VHFWVVLNCVHVGPSVPEQNNGPNASQGDFDGDIWATCL
jgi:hypothetical protein